MESHIRSALSLQQQYVGFMTTQDTSSFEIYSQINVYVYEEASNVVFAEIIFAMCVFWLFHSNAG